MADWDYNQPDGTNATMTYSAAGSAQYNYVRCRVRELSYSWDVVATESHARKDRAFYPHQRAISQFQLKFEMKGYGEFKAWSDFMWNYINTFMGANRKSMYISVPVRRFARWGIPVKGVYDGDHIGSMVFGPRIVFESMNDPLDVSVISDPNSLNYSTPDLSGVQGDQSKFFYPFSAASTDPNVKPEQLYDYGAAPDGYDGITGALNRAIGNAVNNVNGGLDAINRAADDQRRNTGG